jgi:hypothetical protein
MANRPGIIIKKIQNMHADKYGNTSGQKCHPKGSRKETELRESVCRDTENVEHVSCSRLVYVI